MVLARDMEKALCRMKSEERVEDPAVAPHPKIWGSLQAWQCVQLELFHSLSQESGNRVGTLFPYSHIKLTISGSMPWE